MLSDKKPEFLHTGAEYFCLRCSPSPCGPYTLRVFRVHMQLAHNWNHLPADEESECAPFPEHNGQG